MFRKVVVGMSGGVDSAVSAYLLKQKGFKVLGVFMKNWDEYDEAGRCTGEQDLKDAKYVCQLLDIELRQVDYVKDYWHNVFSNFLNDYQNGLTPNPDILCNKYIKFDLFYKYVINILQYDALATGHYAQNSFGNYLENYKKGHDVRLLVPRDKFKDQTFFLSGINRNSLERTMFPIGDMLKSEVKILAENIGLKKLAKKRESTGICFVGRRDFKRFIKEYITSKQGYFVDIDTGDIVGSHNGIHQWTIGQRCRLASFSKPYYVALKSNNKSTIYVAAGHNHKTLCSQKFYIGEINWLCSQSEKYFYSNGSMHCRFRFQHTKPLVNCTVYISDDRTFDKPVYTVKLDVPLRALTPGQYAVFYDETACLGSAQIHHTESEFNIANQYKNTQIVL